VSAVEQALEQGLHGVFGRRLARTHHAVDGNAGSELVGGFVGAQGLRDVGALVQFVGVHALDVLHAGAAQLLQQGFGQLVVGLGDDFAGVGINDVLGQHAAQQEVFRHADELGAGLLQLAGVAAVMRLSLATMTLPDLSVMSKRATSPAGARPRTPSARRCPSGGSCR
jgi:hypothetical protein